MRKRSGLLFLVIGAAILLFLGLFLMWPASEKSMPSQQVSLPVADEESAQKNAATTTLEKPVEPHAKAGEGSEEVAEPRDNAAVGDQPKVAERQDRDQNKAPDDAHVARDDAKSDLQGVLDLVEEGEFDVPRVVAENEGKPVAKDNRRGTRRKPLRKAEKKKLTRSMRSETALEDRMSVFGGSGGRGGKAGNKNAGELKGLSGGMFAFDKNEFDDKQWGVAAKEDPRASKVKAKPKRRRQSKPEPKLKPWPVAERELEPEPEPDPEPQPERLVEKIQAKPPAQRGPRTKMTETSIDPKSTFSIDVDTGSYTLARARMREGYPPKKRDVRIEEFVNYFHYDYPEPVDSEFAVAMEAAPDPLSTTPRRHLVRIGVQGKSVDTDERPPAHLTFLVDVSGSMFGPDQLGLVIESLDLVTRNLRPEDTIALVTFSTRANVVMWPAGAKERDIISRTIATLEPGGSSALDKGLDLAYEVASTHFVAGHINRVVLLGDGRVNAGQTDPYKLLESVRYGVEDGVMLSTIGFGAKSFNDQMMEQLADRGNGAYYFVDSYREAQKVFGDRLCGTLFTIAKDVKIQVDFNPKSVVRHRLLGYENRELKHAEFRNDAVDAGEIGAGHSVTAIYEVDLTEQLDETIATVSVRYKKPDEAVASELNFQLFTEELITDVREASADFKFAAAVAMYAEIARGTLESSEARISLVREIAGEGAPHPEQQPDRVEFLALVDETAMFFVN